MEIDYFPNRDYCPFVTISVYDYDNMLQKDDFLGYADINIANIK